MDYTKNVIEFAKRRDVKKKIIVLMKMTSFGVEPRHCKCGGMFENHETMYATRDGWFCSSCALPGVEPRKQAVRQVNKKKKKA